MRELRSLSLLVATCAWMAMATVAAWASWKSAPIASAAQLVSIVLLGFTASKVYYIEQQRACGGVLAFATASLLILNSEFWALGEMHAALLALASIFGEVWVVLIIIFAVSYPDGRPGIQVSTGLILTNLFVWVATSQVSTALEAAMAGDGTRFSVVKLPIVTVSAVGVAVASTLAVAQLIRVTRGPGIHRIEQVPMVIAACLIVATSGIVTAAQILPSVSFDFLNAAKAASLLLLPLAFGVSRIRQRLVSSSVSDLVASVAGSPDLAGVTEALRGALQDPELMIQISVPEGTDFAEEASDGVRPSNGDDSRWTIPVRRSSGEQLAVLSLDPRLRRHPALVESAVVAVGLALEVQAQIAEVRASRMRIATAAIDERRRLERDLHDGTQQSLLAAAASLGAARLHVPESSETVVAAIDQARKDLQTAYMELRQLARGIHPAVLSQSGLLAAIESVAERLPINIELRIPDQRWRANVETTLYLLVCEALTNTVKHAKADHVSVRLESHDARVDVIIRDDGCGGAAASDGSGLAGMRDRVQALGGTLSIHSPVGRGTSIEAVVPCE